MTAGGMIRLADERRVKSRRLSWALVTLLSFGGVALLLWTKLKIVGDVPRTAYAEPEERDEAREARPREESPPPREGPAPGQR